MTRVTTSRLPLLLARTAVGALLVAVPLPVQSQDWDQVEIQTVRVGDGVYMLTGRGGNLGLWVGEDGAFLIDDQYAPLSEKILAAVREVTRSPVRFVLNTHWHGDHTGGNENMGDAGALLVAHDNVRLRLGMEQVLERFGQVDTVPASPAGALPVVTFTQATSFHLNGSEARAVHVPHAHTDGDAIIHLRAANVVHMGDTYFNGLYPFIDLSSGGSVDGMIAAAETVLGMIDERTAVIPGHGPMSNRTELAAYRDMLVTIRERVAAHIEAGRSLDEIAAAGVSAEWDEALGGGFIPPEALLRAVYASLTAR